MPVKARVNEHGAVQFTNYEGPFLEDLGNEAIEKAVARLRERLRAEREEE